MGNAIKVGGMGSADALGMPPEFAGSMAAAIEAALNTLLAAEGKPELPVDDNSPETRDRRMLFVAIAQGIVNHLTANEAAFVVIDEFAVPTGETIDIQTA